MSPARGLTGLAAGALLIALPLFLNRYGVYILSLWAVMTIAAMIGAPTNVRDRAAKTNAVMIGNPTTAGPMPVVPMIAAMNPGVRRNAVTIAAMTDATTVSLTPRAGMEAATTVVTATPMMGKEGAAANSTRCRA